MDILRVVIWQQTDFDWDSIQFVNMIYFFNIFRCLSAHTTIFLFILGTAVYVYTHTHTHKLCSMQSALEMLSSVCLLLRFTSTPLKEIWKLDMTEHFLIAVPVDSVTGGFSTRMHNKVTQHFKWMTPFQLLRLGCGCQEHSCGNITSLLYLHLGVYSASESCEAEGVDVKGWLHK